MIFIRNDNNKKSVSQACSKSYACLLPPSTLTHVMERISLGFLQEKSETVCKSLTQLLQTFWVFMFLMGNACFE